MTSDSLGRTPPLTPTPGRKSRKPRTIRAQRSEEDDDSTTVRVRIFSQEFKLRGQADPAVMRKLATFVDEKMREVTQEVGSLGTDRVAILAALNIAGELFDRKRSVAQLEQEVDASLGRVEEILSTHLPDGNAESASNE